ncbi:HAD family hydrolase [Amycolatopsis sp. CA-128772]|uniref:HAD family hydrolase n=1 Tax=Amycolatopsis sp. CA-128772 TaxID=2073159 RepID=UPI001E5D9074|nr:HAD family hydrolase [Amycolatopsis sp. CA-128772]
MIRWATFDCFGTLVDWRHGMATGIELLFPGRGGELLEVYNRFEPQVQAETPVRRYREVLAESLRRTAAEAGLELVPDDASVLGTGLPYWPVFPDTRAALAGLREAGWRLALLTNCDRDLIGETHPARVDQPPRPTRTTRRWRTRSAPGSTVCSRSSSGSTPRPADRRHA